MKGALTFLIVLSLAPIAGLSARVINVPGDYGTIQAAIGAAANGDTVLVANGYYDETLNFCGRDIVLGSHFIISGDQSDILATIIDGGGRGPVITLAGGESSSAAIEGLTIQNGLNTFSGGGILVAGSSPVIRSNIIRYNESHGDGGGIALVSGAAPLITHNVIAYNRSSFLNGGGISIEHSAAIIKNNLIIGNRAYK